MKQKKKGIDYFADLWSGRYANNFKTLNTNQRTLMRRIKQLEKNMAEKEKEQQVLIPLAGSTGTTNPEVEGGGPLIDQQAPGATITISDKDGSDDDSDDAQEANNEPESSSKKEAEENPFEVA